MPWLLYEGAQEIETHPLLALLTHPNPQESGTELFERWYAICNAPAMPISKR